MTRLAPILLILLAFTAASCDGDDAPSGDADDAPTQQEFAKQANEVCRQAERSLDNVAEDADEPEDIVAAIDDVIEESRKAVSELEGLERPAGEAGERAEEFVDATRTEIHDEGIPALEQLRDAVESEDQGAIQEAAVRLQGIDSSASNTAARELGATDCAEER
jgi:hypothetical protein